VELFKALSSTST